MNPNLETVFLTVCENYTVLSSTAFREMAACGADRKDFVPKEIVEDVLEMMKI